MPAAFFWTEGVSATMSRALSKWDVIAGLSVAGLLLPEAIAYASIAGLAPQHGVFAAIAGLLVYALFGRSRFAIVAPTSSSAAILAAAAAAAQTAQTPEQRLALAAGAVLLTGVFLLGASLARMGALAQFISRPVLRGFAFGLAGVIVLRQAPALTGLELGARDAAGVVWALTWRWREVKGVSLCLGFGALALLLCLRRWPRAPAPFIVIAAGVACAYAFDLDGLGVSRVGHLDVTPVAPGFPDLSQSSWEALGRVALPLVLIIFAESWGSMRSLGLRHGDRLNPQRELFALGLANIASGLLRGLPVGAGFSASSANEAAGAVSRMAGLVAGLCMVALAALFAPLVARIPQPVLAAVVVYAVSPALDPRPLLHLWRIGRDQYLALAAALGVLILGVVDGMVLAVALSVVATLGRLASPRIERLGRLPGGRAYVDLAAHPEALCDPRILVVRPTEALFFANAETIFARMDDELPRGQGTPVVILSLEDSSDLDATALEALIEWEAQLAAQGRVLLLARCKQHVRDLLLRAHPALAGSQRSFWSVDEAFEAALALVEAPPK